jgi:hypothetical protein
MIKLTLVTALFAAHLNLSVYAQDSRQSVRLPSGTIIDKYGLFNPSQFSSAVVHAHRLEANAKKLRTDGEQQMRTQDLRSGLSGEISSMEHVRKRGRENIVKADAFEKEAKQILSAIEEMESFYSQRLSELPNSKPISIKGLNGNSITCSIIGFYGGVIIAKRQIDEALVGIGFKQVQVSSHRSISLELLQTIPAAYHSPDHQLDVIAELSNGVLVRNSSGNLTFRKPVIDDKALDGKLEKRILQEIEDIEFEIRTLQKEINLSPGRSGAKGAVTNLALGQPQSFIVDRILSFEDFPLSEYGEFIYQVSIGGNPTILITKHTQYLTAGRGSLLLRSVGNRDVTMKNGSPRTVPVLVEVDAATIESYQELIETREEKVACIKDLSSNRQAILNIDRETNGILISSIQ